MHVLMVHSDPRFYREVRSLLDDCGATGAYQPSLDGISYQVEAQSPDLIILEQGCLAKDSNQLAGAFRPGQRLPLIFLTSASGERICSGDERNRLAQLLGHLRVQQERSRQTQVLQIGQLRIHAGRMRVAINDRWVRLPPIQFRILQHLAANVNELVTHRELMSIVWGDGATNDKNPDLLKVHITQLRRRLGPDFRNYIQAVRGQGYVFVDPAEDESVG